MNFPLFGGFVAWTYVHRLPARTSIESLLVRPEVVWTYVVGMLGRTSRGRREEKKGKVRLKRAQKRVESTYFGTFSLSRWHRK